MYISKPKFTKARTFSKIMNKEAKSFFKKQVIFFFAVVFLSDGP